MSITSRYLGTRSLIALSRIGDIFCPENAEFPSYSQCGCLEHVDKMMATVPENDQKDLNLVLSIISFMPDFMLVWLIQKMAKSHEGKGFLSPIFRQLDFGLKGIILGTYYSGKTGKQFTGKNPLQVIGFELNRIVD